MDQMKIKNKVENNISKLIEEFKKYPEKFLTEEDVRSYLYHILMKNFNTIQYCEDNTKSIPIHCEVRWYGESGKRRWLFDIALLDVSTLNTKKWAGLKLPSKGYGFIKPLIIIEIKLRRKGTESDNQFIKRINGDRSKIQKVRDDLTTNFDSYLLIFDKRRDITLDIHNVNRQTENYIYPYK